MANSDLSLLDIVKLNADDGIAPVIEATTVAVPQVNRAARTIPGTQYNTLIRTANPSGGFRNANEGVDRAKSTYENSLVQCYYMDIRNAVDKMVATRNDDGWQACMALEMEGNMAAQMAALGSQFFWGVSTTYQTSAAASYAKGFPGLQDVVASANIVNAGGSTGGTISTVWLVRFGAPYVQWVVGSNGRISASEVTMQVLQDSNSKDYTAYYQTVEGWIGLQVHNPAQSIVLVKNVSTDSGAGLTDALLAQAYEKFPENTPFSEVQVFMSKRSWRQLQASRTATNPTGAPAPFPTAAFDMPLNITTSIADNNNAV